MRLAKTLNTTDEYASTAMELYQASAHETLPEHTPIRDIPAAVAYVFVFFLLPALLATWPLLMLAQVGFSEESIAQDTFRRQFRWLIWMRVLARLAARYPRVEVIRSVAPDDIKRMNNVVHAKSFRLKIRPMHGETLLITLNFTQPNENTETSMRTHGLSVKLHARGERLAAGLSKTIAHQPDFLKLHVQGKDKVHCDGELQWTFPSQLTNMHTADHPLLEHAGFELADFIARTLHNAGVTPTRDQSEDLKPLHVSRKRAPALQLPAKQYDFALKPGTTLPKSKRSPRWLRIMLTDPPNAAVIGMFPLITWVAGLSAVGLALAAKWSIALFVSLFFIYCLLGTFLITKRLMLSFGAPGQPRWNTDTQSIPLTLTPNGLLTTQHTTIDLNLPFKISLSRAHTLGRLHLHLSQRAKTTNEVARITIAVRSSTMPSDIPVLDTSAHWIASRSFATELWPTIQAYAENRGVPCPWDFSENPTTTANINITAKAKATVTAH